MPHRLLLLLALIALLLPACATPTGDSGSGGSGDDDDSAAGDDDDTMGDDDDTTADDDDDDDDDDVAPETDCGDGVDNDGDSAIDCDDKDCAAAPECNQPAQLDVTVTLDYEASFLAELAGYEDCITVILSLMDPMPGHTCTQCDDVYAGPYTYQQDTCPQDPASPRPTEGNFGLIFTDGNSWDVYGDDGTGTGNYNIIGTATNDGSGLYSLTRVDGVPNDGGDLTTTITFLEPIPE
jgi:hypothetical protein